MEQQSIYQSPHIEGTLNHIKLTLTKLKQTQHQTPNLSKAERKVLVTLKNNKDLVINSADKGSTIVAQDRSNYIKKNWNTWMMHQNTSNLRVIQHTISVNR